MSNVDVQSSIHFNCRCPVVLEGRSAEVSWSCKGVDSVKLEYFDGVEFHSLDSLKGELNVNDTKIIKNLRTNTVLTLTSMVSDKIVSQKQVYILVVKGSVQTSGGKSLQQFMQARVLADEPLEDVVKEACYKFLLDPSSPEDLITVCMSLKNQGVINWNLFKIFIDNTKATYSNLLDLYANCHLFTSAFDVYTEADMSKYIKSLNQETLITQSHQGAHLTHKEALYSNIIEPVLMAFPANHLEYWYYCCCKALKGQGVAESDVSYCMCKLFKAKAWDHAMHYGSLLTLIFNEEHMIKTVASLSTKGNQKPVELNHNQPKETLPKESIEAPTTSLKETLISLGVEEVVMSREKLLLADFQASLYEKIFSHLAAHYPCNKEGELEAWLKNVGVELKAVKIGQATASYCVARYIADKGWEFSLDLSEILIDLYQTETVGA